MLNNTKYTINLQLVSSSLVEVRKGRPRVLQAAPSFVPLVLRLSVMPLTSPSRSMGLARCKIQAYNNGNEQNVEHHSLHEFKIVTSN